MSQFFATVTPCYAFCVTVTPFALTVTPITLTVAPMAYTKLHQSLITSTVWREPHTTRIVWVTMMLMADKNGEVMASIPGLAHMAMVTIEECEAALTTFMSPDKYSRTKAHDGRKIEEINGGWFLLNHSTYRAMASKEDETQKAAARMARHRRNKELQSVTKP